MSMPSLKCSSPKMTPRGTTEIPSSSRSASGRSAVLSVTIRTAKAGPYQGSIYQPGLTVSAERHPARARGRRLLHGDDVVVVRLAAEHHLYLVAGVALAQLLGP